MNTADKVAHFAQDAADTITSAGHQARAAFDERSEQILRAEQYAAKSCRSYVRTNPVTSLGIAAATGFLVGSLLGLSRR
ncbi:MAG: DUF883 domain-containing protein [Methylococcales bacterium]|nr:DUF883 domain-containing protein [Methylococcales bacterium]MDP3010332.1 DUF883 domain-containing protein [Methylococcales bacterium]